MRLDLACLVAPKPQVPSMPTRRAFLFAGSTLAFGVSIGGACGYVIGVNSASSSAGAKDAELDLAAGLAPTGDPDLDELRGWALKSPIEELESHIQVFMEQVRSTYTSDQYLWHGMERLVDRVLAGQHTGWPRLCKQVLIQTIELADPAVLPKNGLRLQARLPEMKRVK
ncbi:MAG TPA: hypothetical protein VFD82_08805 [Planctomycetota bacterium]|nr:hypothetical protein [Planctomycetota bacterium]